VFGFLTPNCDFIRDKGVLKKSLELVTSVSDAFYRNQRHGQSITSYVRDDGNGCIGQSVLNNKRTGGIGQETTATQLTSTHFNEEWVQLISKSIGSQHNENRFLYYLHVYI
jgi:hypothetical protein